MLRDRYQWYWTYVFHTTVGEVTLTLVLMGIYITGPTDIDWTLNETSTDKMLQYRVDYNNRPSHRISFIPTIGSTEGHLHCEFVLLLFL
jgi:hypothetical protein